MLNKSINYVHKSIYWLFNKILPLKLNMYLAAVDRTLRYNYVAEELNKLQNIYKIKLSVLDVGGSNGFFINYLNMDNYEYTVLDQDADAIKKAKSRGLKAMLNTDDEIPLSNDSYDLVISIDTLEHINQDKRTKFLDELKRVSSKAVILHCPFGEAGEIVSKKLLKLAYYSGDNGKWLRDNIEYGLPRLEQLNKAFPNNRSIQYFNSALFLIISYIQMIPILKLFLPGVIYLIFDTIIGKREPFVCCCISWRKSYDSSI